MKTKKVVEAVKALAAKKRAEAAARRTKAIKPESQKPVKSGLKSKVLKKTGLKTLAERQLESKVSRTGLRGQKAQKAATRMLQKGSTVVWVVQTPGLNYCVPGSAHVTEDECMLYADWETSQRQQRNATGEWAGFDNYSTESSQYNAGCSLWCYPDESYCGVFYNKLEGMGNNWSSTACKEVTSCRFDELGSCNASIEYANATIVLDSNSTKDIQSNCGAAMELMYCFDQFSCCHELEYRVPARLLEFDIEVCKTMGFSLPECEEPVSFDPNPWQTSWPYTFDPVPGCSSGTESVGWDACKEYAYANGFGFYEDYSRESAEGCFQYTNIDGATAVRYNKMDLEIGNGLMDGAFHFSVCKADSGGYGTGGSSGYGPDMVCSHEKFFECSKEIEAGALLLESLMWKNWTMNDTLATCSAGMEIEMCMYKVDCCFEWEPFLLNVSADLYQYYMSGGLVMCPLVDPSYVEYCSFASTTTTSTQYDGYDDEVFLPPGLNFSSEPMECPANHMRVYDLVHCQAAAQAIGQRVFEETPNDQWPAGCYVYGSMWYFNSGSGGYYDSPSVRLLCEKGCDYQEWEPCNASMTQLGAQYSGYTHKDNLTKDEKMHYCSVTQNGSWCLGHSGCCTSVFPHAIPETFFVIDAWEVCQDVGETLPPLWCAMEEDSDDGYGKGGGYGNGPPDLGDCNLEQAALCALSLIGFGPDAGTTPELCQATNLYYQCLGGAGCCDLVSSAQPTNESELIAAACSGLGEPIVDCEGGDSGSGGECDVFALAECSAGLSSWDAPPTDPNQITEFCEDYKSYWQCQLSYPCCGYIETIVEAQPEVKELEEMATTMCETFGVDIVTCADHDGFYGGYGGYGGHDGDGKGVECGFDEQLCYVHQYSPDGEIDWDLTDKQDPVCVAWDESCPCNTQWEEECESFGYTYCEAKSIGCFDPFDVECAESEVKCQDATGAYCWDPMWGSCPVSCTGNETLCSGMVYTESGEVNHSAPERQFCAAADTGCPCDPQWEKKCSDPWGFSWCVPGHETCPLYCADDEKECFFTPYGADGFPDWELPHNQTCVPADQPCPCHPTFEDRCENEFDSYCEAKVWGGCPVYCTSDQITCWVTPYKADGTIDDEGWTESCADAVDGCPCDPVWEQKCTYAGVNFCESISHACPVDCGDFGTCWHWLSGNESCATDTGCVCESNEISCTNVDTNLTECFPASYYPNGCPLECRHDQIYCSIVSFDTNGLMLWEDYCEDGEANDWHCPVICKADSAQKCGSGFDEYCVSLGETCPLICEEQYCWTDNFAANGDWLGTTESCAAWGEQCPCGAESVRCTDPNNPDDSWCSPTFYGCPLICNELTEKTCFPISFTPEGRAPVARMQRCAGGRTTSGWRTKSASRQQTTAL
ncbi:unnamed protein product [Symbiodinium necroappetens]|uniref:Uncharacterized protein n=1 Tax=Symbiodinium necroappetens TaxID=1628268 RepID=A0A812XJ73_9DINO|nr:unnamed protein product [Symbiodinium necroappetens]